MHTLHRRTFLKTLTAATAGLAPLGRVLGSEAKPEPPRFQISLAEWSLHRNLKAGKISNLEFPGIARKEFDIGAVEYVNSFFKDKAGDTAYLTELRKRCEDAGVRSLLIMCDGEGNLGDPDDAQRTQAVENHYKWVEAAKFLGCHSIRVNAKSKGTYQEQLDLAADGLGRLSEFAAGHDLNVLVENHGGLSSKGKWLVKLMKQVDRPNCGTLPDFGNFWGYDRYLGVEETLPYAKALSAKSHEFDADGNETKTDYKRMMQLALEADYRGYVGIEYEGGKVGEYEGIRLTRDLLQRVIAEVLG